MKIMLLDASILIFYLIQSSSSADDSNLLHARERSSRILKHHVGDVRKKPRFISFDSKDGKIEVNWEVSVPFISIPLDDEGNVGNGGITPLLNVNAKALTVAGLVTAIVAFVIPLLTKSTPEMQYRADRSSELSEIGNAFNDIIFSNIYVAPCMQRIICTMVSIATRAENPTSTDQIVHGFSSNKWFNELINGTMIHEAVVAGREGNHDCSYIYKTCPIPLKLLRSMMRELGMI